MTLKQLDRALDVIARCRQAAERAASDADRARWSTSAERLELALRSRGYNPPRPNGARLGATFDESLERLIEDTHELVQ